MFSNSEFMREILQRIGQRIKETREEKGITQKQLGEYLGYSPMGISYFEQGLREMKVSDLEKLASYFGKEVSFFLSPSLTMFRVEEGGGEDEDTTKSLQDFENFLQQRKRKG